MKLNNEIRSKAKEKGIKLWEVAEALKMQDSAFSRKLRYELTEEEKTKILSLIDEIAERRVNNE